MKQEDLLEAHVQVKRMSNLLVEVEDLSRQMAEAVDRNDQVTVRMLLSMRQTPIDNLKIAEQTLRQKIASFEVTEDAQRLAALLNGSAPQEDAEASLVAQVAANARLYNKVIALDKAINRKIAGEKSVYQAKPGAE